MAYHRTAPVLPCVRCGDPAGTLAPSGAVRRLDGRRFGWDGEICADCYSAVSRNPAAVRRLRARPIADAVLAFAAALVAGGRMVRVR